jgi:hypothetical protein
MLVFVPMAFSASWASGFANCPDFCIMMIAIPTLLLALGFLRARLILHRAGEFKEGA